MKKIILPEIISAGLYDAQTIYRDKAQTPLRKTTMFELELPIGNGGISYINQESAEITENIIICAKPNAMRHTQLPFKCYFVHMTVPEGSLIDHLMALPTFLPVPDRSVFEPLFVQISNYCLTISPRRNILHASKLLELIYLMSSLSNRISDPYNEAVIRAISYIKENLEDDLSLQTLATYTGLSPTYFHSSFKKYTGKNLREFIEEQRIKKATNLLLSTRMTLTEIAYACGFSSQSYFSYAFKRKMKMTPREYVADYFRRYEI